MQHFSENEGNLDKAAQILPPKGGRLFRTQTGGEGIKRPNFMLRNRHLSCIKEKQFL